MGPLLDRADSILVIVDMQTGFFAAHDGLDRDALARTSARVAWLAGVASALDIPVIVTEEDPTRNGPTDPAIRSNLATGTPVFEKVIFGLADQANIIAAIVDTGRTTVVLAGVETDVCVTHSALGMLDRGYRVAVVSDATFSPGEMQAHGLRRMVEAGVAALHAKGVYYEWVRTLEAARAFEADHPGLAEPPGFSL